MAILNIGNPFVWLHRRHIAAFDWIMVSLLCFWGYLLILTHRGSLPSGLLYSHMTDLAPWWVWVAASFVGPVLVVVFVWTQRWPVLYASLIWKGVFWTVIAVMGWQAGHSLLTPSVIAVFALGPIFRYADIKVARDARESPNG